MKKLVLLFVAIFLFVACSTEDNKKDNNRNLKSLSSSNEVKVAFIADQGVGESSKELLRLIRDEGSELLVISGDFGYEKDPKRWANMHQEILGSFPIIAVAGNHDVDMWKNYKKLMKEWGNELNCTGEAGERQVCEYKGIKIVTTTPNIFANQPSSIDEQFIKDAFKEDRGEWRICSWHKNMHDMQTGNKSDETGWGVYEECQKAGAIIITGHEHAYSRSYLLDDIPNKHIVHKNDQIDLKKGQSVVVVSGLGGQSSRHLIHDGDWWAAKANADTGTQAGALFCTFNEREDHKKATCYFKDILGNILDEFELYQAR